MVVQKFHVGLLLSLTRLDWAEHMQAAQARRHYALSELQTRNKEMGDHGCAVGPRVDAYRRRWSARERDAHVAIWRWINQSE